MVPQTHGNRLEADASRGRLLTGLYSHAAAWRDLASISVPCDLRLREASDARRRNHCAVSLGDRLDSLALLETSHNCRKTRTGGGCETGRCSFLLQELAWFLEPTVSCWLPWRPQRPCVGKSQPIYSSPASLYPESRQETALPVTDTFGWEVLMDFALQTVVVSI